MTSRWFSEKKFLIGKSAVLNLVTKSQLRNNGSISVTIYEDVGANGTGNNTDAIGNSYDNSLTVELFGGNEINRLTGFTDSGQLNAYWFKILLDGNNNATSNLPTVNTVELQKSGPAESITWQTAADWDNAQAAKLGHHQSPNGTEWAPDSVFEAGYPEAFTSFSQTCIGYYPLQETTGTNAYDVTGNATTGTYANTTLSNTVGPFGRTYPTFNGTDSGINTGKTFVGSGGNIAICAWFKIPSYTTDWQVITNSYDGSVGLSLQRNGSNNELMLNIDGPSSYQRTSVSYTPDDQWHWIYGHRDAANSEQLVRLDDTVNTTGVGDLVESTSNHFIGSGPGRTSSWNGELAHVMYFDGPLTTIEQDELYNAPY